jgi:hypothetical protein
MSDFDDLSEEVDRGMSGANVGIPMGFNRLNNHVTIRKHNNYLIGGFTGTGKSSILDDAFVLNPIDFILRNRDNPNIPKLEIVYWSMERPKKFKLIKWIARKIFLDEGRIIPVNRWMGWVPPQHRITSEERDIFNRYEEYISAILEIVHFKDDYMEHNPTGMRNFMRDTFFPARGRIETWEENGVKHREYIPNDPTKIILNITDHLGKIRREKNLSNRKEIVDKCSEDKSYWRDFYGCSSIDISQFNRDISNPTRIKNGDVEPMLEDFKDSGNTAEDADVVISLFDPMRYKVPDPGGYDLTKLNLDQGKKKYRSLRILKNSYGTDDVRIGLAFQPEIGLFAEMPKRDIITPAHYDSITDNTYFLPHNH